MDKFYEYEIIAKTGTQDIDSIEGYALSINDAGKVAFIGYIQVEVPDPLPLDPENTIIHSTYQLFVGESLSTLTNVTSQLIKKLIEDSEYELYVGVNDLQINNANQVIVKWDYNDVTVKKGIRIFDTNNNSFKTIVSGESEHPGINNLGESVFVTPIEDTQGYLLVNADSTGSSLNKLLVPDPGNLSEFDNDDPSIPMIADNGDVVIKFGPKLSSPVRLFDNTLKESTTISSGFSKTVEPPRISDNGEIVAFVGERDNQPGIFAWINGTAIRIAGISGNGILDPGEAWVGGVDVGPFKSFGDFNDDDDFYQPSVAVNSMCHDSALGKLAYVAFDEFGNKGIYTNYLINSGSEFTVSSPELVVEVGDVLPGLSGTVNDVFIEDSVNASGQVAFWASTSSGKTAVIRAIPQTNFVVNTTGDEEDPTPGDGNPDVDPVKNGLQVTLRSLLQYANDTVGLDQIKFDIPTSDPGYNEETGTWKININKALPTIIDTVHIDGLVEATGKPGIEISGTNDSFNGLTIDTCHSIVRGLVINNFNGHGIELKDKGNIIENNYIGTDVTGKKAKGNSKNGIDIKSDNNIIKNNVISANGKFSAIPSENFSGISITSNITANTIKSNKIGTDVDGTQALGNQLNGIFISDRGGNTIKNNLISGNKDDGIDIRNASNNVIQSNIIGADITGQNNLGNGEAGINLERGNNNQIGGENAETEGNIIAFNQGTNNKAGVSIFSGIDNAILGNLIFDNQGLGIDLGNDGFTPNDPNDNDVGSNNLQNTPVINSITQNGLSEQTTITGSLNSTPNSTFKLEFFNKQGKDFLGSQSVTTDELGNTSFDFTTNILDVNSVIATATDSNGNTSEFSNSRNLFPLRVEGNFFDNDEDGVFEAEGTILIGRIDGLFPLIRLEGEAKYDDRVFSAEGEVFSAIQNASYTNNEILNKSLFTGKFDIDIGKSSTNPQQFKETKVVSEDAKIGGLNVEFTSLDLQKTGISLDGNFTLPEKIGGLNIPDSINSLGGLEVEAKGTDALFIGKQGIGFGSESGKIKIPFGETNVFDFVGIKPGEADLVYQPNEEKLDIQGKFNLRTDLLQLKLDKSPKFTLDLEGEGLSPKSIQIKDGIADIDAVIKTEDAVLELPLGFELTDFEAALKSSQGKLSDVVGKIKVLFPWNKIVFLPESIVGEIGFKKNNSTVINENDAPFVVDDVVLELEGANIPIKPPFLYLNDMKGGIKNLTPAKDENIEYVGGIGLSIGSEIKFNSPTFLGIDVLDKVFGIDLSNGVSLAKIKLEVEPGFQEVQNNGKQESELVALGGKAGLSIINEKILKSEVELKWNWAKELFEASGTTKIFNGVFEGSNKIKIDYDDTPSLVLSGKGQLKVPDSPIFFGARGKTYSEANAALVFTDNNNYSDDSFAIWATFTLPNATPYTIGFKTSFDGDFSRISSTKEIPPIGSWDVEDGTPWLILTATWENPTSNNVSVRVKNSDGNFIDENDFAANNIYIVEELSGAYSKTIIVNNPTAGIWDYVLVDDTGLGEIQYTASRDSIAPTIEIAATPVNGSEPEINITYKAFDGDSDAEISLFYDTDNQDFDGVAIAQGIAETDGQGSFVWNPEGLPSGEYFIYAAIFDENNAPVFSYTTEKIQVLPDVNENTAPIITSDATFSVAENTTTVGTITATDVDGNDLTFSLVGGADQRLFTINESGELSFNAAPDFETAADADADNNYQVTIGVSDGSETVTQDLTVSVTDENEEATDIALSNSSVAENDTAAIIGDLTVTDVDSSSFTYTVDDNRFEVVNSQLKLKDTKSLDFETETSINLEITATDNGNPNQSFTKNFAIAVTNVNEAPTVNNATFTVNENSEEETQVGITTAIDPESEALTFAIANGNIDLDTDGNLAFAIDSSTGTITVNDKDDLDFETTPTFNLEVLATDAGDLSDTANITVNLNDVPPAQFDTESNNGIFTLNGGDPTNIKFTLANNNTENVNEVGVFVVDDENGNIDGNVPGSEGYLKAALQRSQVIFSAIFDRPSGFDLGDIERVLEVDSDAHLGFYLVSNGTTDTALAELEANGTTSLPIFFSDSSNLQLSDLSEESFKLNWSDEADSSNFTNLDLTVQLTQDTPAPTTELQGNPQNELIDLSNKTGSVSVSVEVHREAAFDNLIGFYQIVDTKGGIDTNGDGIADFNPGDTGYEQAALTNRITGLDLLQTDNQQTSTFDGTFDGGSILASFMVADGTVDEAINNNAEVYFSFLGANSDGVDHIRLLGDNTFGYEDLAGGGDFDYNDMIVKFDLTTV